MTVNKNPASDEPLRHHLAYLKLTYTQEHFESLAEHAAKEHQPHVHYLNSLMEGEALQRQDRAVHRRIQLARFPSIKTLEQFNWTWPKKINRL